MGSGSLSPEAARRRDPCPGETGRRTTFLCAAAKRRPGRPGPLAPAPHGRGKSWRAHVSARPSYEIRLNGSGVIPDARNARDRESRARPAFLRRLWIPGQACGLPGMTQPKRTGSAGIRITWRARPGPRCPQRASITTMATSSFARAGPRKARTSSITALMRASGESSRCRLKALHRRSCPKNSLWRFCVSVIPSV